MSVTISTRNLVKKYGSRVVVNHVSFEVKQGEIVGLLGPNGAGKTTSFYQVVGLVKPDEGKVFLNDRDITSLPMYKRAQMGIGYLPQEASVFRKLSVEDNISAILEMTKLSKKQQREKLESLLTEFRLKHVRKSNGDVLSGGERRRTEIARALSVDPKFILLDEPFAGIDPIAVEDIQAIVAKLKTKNIGILITDHNVQETLSICDRAYLLIEGKIFKHGTAEELAEDEQVRKLYLGRNFELKRKDYLHEEARADHKIIRYIDDLLVTMKSITDPREDDIGNESYQVLNGELKFDEFSKYWNSVVEHIEESDTYQSNDKLADWIGQIRALKIENQFEKDTLTELVDVAGITTYTLNSPLYTTLAKTSAFKAIEKAKPLFENCRRAIENPAWTQTKS